MNYKIKQKSIFLFALLLFGTVIKGMAQDHSAAIAAADSSGFSVNKADGWQMFNSYINKYKADSVRIELIVQHSNNINWKVQQYIGKIKQANTKPAANRNIYIDLITVKYVLQVNTNGKCYVKWVSGSLPTGNPVVLPIMGNYKL